MLGNGDANGARQLVGVALNKSLEGLLRVELWVELLWNGGVEHRGRLVGASGGLGAVDGGGLFALHHLHLPVLAVYDEAVLQFGVLGKALVERPSHQTHVVLLQILVDVRAWNLHQHCLLLFVVAFEDNGLEPRFIYLLCDVLPDEV